MQTRSLVVIEMGIITRQTWLTTRLRGRALPAVTLMFRRAWCHESGSPRSREASKSNPVTNGVILRFDPMSCAQPRNGGERDMLGGEIPPSGCVRSGAHKRGGFTCAKPPAGFGPKPHMAIRVKCSLGSFNACWRRESGRSDANQPAEKNYQPGIGRKNRT